MPDSTMDIGRRERRRIDRRTGAERRVNSMRAPELLREDHLRLRSLVDELQHQMDPNLRRHMVELLLSEVRVHRVITEEIFIPAIQTAHPGGYPIQGWPSSRRLLPWLEVIQRAEPDSAEAQAAWRSAASAVQQHIDQEERNSLPAIENANVNLVEVGLRMAMLRRAVIADYQGARRPPDATSGPPPSVSSPS